LKQITDITVNWIWFVTAYRSWNYVCHENSHLSCDTQ